MAKCGTQQLNGSSYCSTSRGNILIGEPPSRLTQERALASPSLKHVVLQRRDNDTQVTDILHFI